MGKPIQLFLLNGRPDGVAIAELSNWTGQLMRIPRPRLPELSHRKDIQSTGVYFLFGLDENDKMMVYIGETDNVYKRLMQHYSDEKKEFWQEAVAVVASKNSLNKAGVRYLEELFHRRAKEVNRYKIMNSQTPSGSPLSESEISTLNEFAENVILILGGALAHKLFEPINTRKVVINPVDNTITQSPTTPSDDEESDNIIYELTAKNNRGKAYGYPTNDGFLVLKGSYVDLVEEHSPYIPAKVRLLRDKLNDDEILKEDILFRTASAAAKFVFNGSVNGKIMWKTPDGRTLNDVERVDSQRIQAELDKQEEDTDEDDAL